MTHSRRYDRQIAVPEIGFSGQQKLHDARVLVIGAGGLGCPVLQNLAGAGVGCIGIVDGDVVEETNLHRQLLYTAEDCGKNKAVVAASAIVKQNPEIKVNAYANPFTKVNAFEIVSDYGIIVDCTDNLTTRYLINDVALVKNIPMVYASIHRFEGQLSVLNYKDGPSYRCLFPEKDDLDAAANCQDLGVMGTLPNILGLLQANEILKIILEIGSVISGNLLLYDGLNNKTQNIGFQKNEMQIQNGLQKGFSILNQPIITEAKAIDAAFFFRSITQNDYLIIDLRESYEEPQYGSGNIKTVPLSELEKELTTTARDQKIILFCQHGNNSLHAANYLIKNGFTDVSHLQNGTAALEKMKT
jgi:molybdopterin/thiamine biosynthesis adenylyltransferase/rhodanese-related sulfurtransferase